MREAAFLVAVSRVDADSRAMPVKKASYLQNIIGAHRILICVRPTSFQEDAWQYFLQAGLDRAG